MTEKQTRKDRIVDQALDLLKNSPNGYRYSQLHKELCRRLPKIPANTIHGTMWDLDQKFPDKVVKPSRGLFLHISFQEVDTSAKKKVGPIKSKIRESDFYEPLADWLVNELEECTKAIPLGRNKFKDKWGTPDVIGKRESKRSDIIPAPIEVVSAEVKIDTYQLVTAFGQACAYRLFSHKSYLVIPNSSPQDDLARMNALCMLYGIGLVLFDNATPRDPKFDIQMRALKHEPDMFYVNKYLVTIEDELFS